MALVASEKDILVLSNHMGHTALRIDENGKPHLEGIKPDQAAVEFWDAVSDWLPADKQEYIQTKTRLIRLIAVMKQLHDNKAINYDKLPDQGQFFGDIMAEISETFDLRLI